ncbi:MAG: hypothetical protein AAGJ37_09445 [Pseudomonadota bacterium]
MRASVEAFFKKYVKAWDSFDADSIATFYRLPCAISDSDGVRTYSDAAELRKKFEKNYNDMYGFGYKSARFNILNQSNLSQDQVAITVGWRIKTETQKLEFRTLYICHLLNDAWLIVSANIYPESFEDIS